MEYCVWKLTIRYSSTSSLQDPSPYVPNSLRATAAAGSLILLIFSSD
jgi:hypothetical protein